MANIRDVAQRAGVSVGSVSAALNQSASVSKEMRRKVLAAVEELGYTPDGVARSLKLGKTHTIGLVISDIANPHFTAMVSAIEVACDAAGYTLTLCNSAENSDKEMRHLEVMRSQRVDGLILDLSGSGPDYAARLRRTIAVPAVMIDRTVEGLLFDSVLIDNVAAGRMVTEYLLRSGHRRIAVVAGRAGVSTSTDRIAGYREALEDNGIAFDPNLVVAGDFQTEPAAAAARILLNRRPRPTAFFSINNLMTIGVMKELRDQGFRCPEDISIVGVDDFEWSNAFAPRLTTAAQPIADIGARAVQCLLERLTDQYEGAPRRTILTPRLIVRDSVRDLTPRPQHRPVTLTPSD